MTDNIINQLQGLAIFCVLVAGLFLCCNKFSAMTATKILAKFGAAAILVALIFMVGAYIILEPKIMEIILWVLGGLAALAIFVGGFILMSRIWADHSVQIVRELNRGYEQNNRSHERIHAGYQSFYLEMAREMNIHQQAALAMAEEIGEQRLEVFLQAFQAGAYLAGGNSTTNQYLVMAGGKQQVDLAQLPEAEVRVIEQIEEICH